MNFDDFKYKKYDDFAIGKYEFYLEDLKKEFIEDLTNNEEYKTFFKNYDPKSIAPFILKYAEHKVHLIKCKDVFLKEEAHNKILQYREDTLERFSWIKQKKLFNLQLLWRAEKIKIKEIDLSYDFEFWEEHIDDCPFLSPIIEEEVNVLKEYLKLNNLDYINRFNWHEWQSYGEIMTPNQDGSSSYPEFYKLYDGHLNTGDLLNLPNIRGEKEERYWRLDWDRKKAIKDEEELKNPKPPYVPIVTPEYLHKGSEELLDYVRLFEKDEHIIELFRLNDLDMQEVRRSHSDWDDENIDESLQLLFEASEPVTMEANDDYELAIVNCAQKYINQMIIEELDVVFEEYNMLAELKISKSENLDELMELKKTASPRKYYDTDILDGREASGEPRDYNF